MKNFSYIVSSPIKDGRVSPYMIYNSEIQYGNIENARNFLRYVENSGTKDEYRLYKISFEEIQT